MRKTPFALGVVAASLGILWLLQGLGIVSIRPILCFANCAPVQGPSAIWAIIGAVMVAVGGAAVTWSFQRRRR